MSDLQFQNKSNLNRHMRVMHHNADGSDEKDDDSLENTAEEEESSNEDEESSSESEEVDVWKIITD